MKRFILIVDKDEDPVDVMSGDSVVDYVFQVIRAKDVAYSNDAPHVAWEFSKNSGGYSCEKLKEIIHKDSGLPRGHVERGPGFTHMEDLEWCGCWKRRETW
jgi:hypothetical protein